MMQKTVFSLLPESTLRQSKTPANITYIFIRKDIVRTDLITQFTLKAPAPDKITFLIL